MAREGETYRLMDINYGLRESHKRFHEYLNTKDKQDGMSITVVLSELLMWISLSDEWHSKNDKDGLYRVSKSKNLGGRYVKGLRYAFNSIKHDMSFIKLIAATGKKKWFIKGYYIDDYTTDIIWRNADPLIEYDKKYENQRQNYIRYIEGKSVIETVDTACEFLNKVYANVEIIH